MAWAVWLQDRLALSSLLLLYAAAAGYIALKGRAFLSAYDTMISPACRAGSSSALCQRAQSMLLQHTSQLTIVESILYVIVLATGMFIGGPLVARELESGSFRFAWTQGMGRYKWLTGKLVVIGLAIMFLAAGLGALGSWFASPFELAGAGSQLEAGLFKITVITYPAWAIMAFAVGVLAGAMLRRVVPAIVSTALSLALMAGLIFWKLNSLILGLFPSTAHGSPAALGTAFGSPRATQGPGGTWVLDQWLVGAGGHKGSLAVALRDAGYLGTSQMAHWLQLRHLTLWWSYQSVSRLGMIQLLESISLIGVAALVGAGAGLWLRQHSV